MLYGLLAVVIGVLAIFGGKFFKKFALEQQAKQEERIRQKQELKQQQKQKQEENL